MGFVPNLIQVLLLVLMAHLVQGIPEFVPDFKGLMLDSYIADTTHVSASPHEALLAEQLFSKLLTSRNYSNDDVQAWESIGLKLQTAQDNNKYYAVVSELDPLEGVGHGFYAIQLNANLTDLNKFLQAPHRPSDLYTHEIAYDLLVYTSVFNAAAWATTHRNNVDLCKQEVSFYNAFTKAVANTKDAVILQLHGFNKHSHEVDTDVIFSSTNKDFTPDPFHPIFDCVKKNLDPWNCALYPEEIDFLGGTTNVNAHNFYAVNPTGRFVHFETSKELREELRVNEELQGLLSLCFQ